MIEDVFSTVVILRPLGAAPGAPRPGPARQPPEKHHQHPGQDLSEKDGQPLDALAQLAAVKRLAPAVALNDHERFFFNMLVAGKPIPAGAAYAAAADAFAVCHCA